MNSAHKCSLGLLLASLLVGGCDKPAPKPASEATAPAESTMPAAGKKEENHAHGTGPNGGVVIDLGKYHAEFTVDHPAKECTVLFVTGDKADSKPLPVAATEFTLTTKETKTEDGTVVAPMTITLKPVDAEDGKASKFVGTDPGIGNVADFEGTLLGEIDGKPSEGKFKE